MKNEQPYKELSDAQNYYLLAARVLKASDLFIQAFDKGDRLAQYQLGLLYYQGKDVPTDYIKARKYMVLAMEKKLLSAYLVMGSMLEHGYGITKDVIRAYTLYCYCNHYGMPNLDDLMEDVLGTLNNIESIL